MPVRIRLPARNFFITNMDTSKYCIHFNGLMNNFCKAGINYESVALDRKRPCFGTGGRVCERYQHYSTEELRAQENERNRFVELLSRNLSACCEAPIDYSQVIADGPHKGHGRRFCSKCHKVVFTV